MTPLLFSIQKPVLERLHFFVLEVLLSFYQHQKSLKIWNGGYRTYESMISYIVCINNYFISFFHINIMETCKVYYARDTLLSFFFYYRYLTYLMPQPEARAANASS